MSERDVERFEAAAGELLDKLGYPRAVQTPSKAARTHAARIKREFTEVVRSRSDGVPKTWQA